MMHRREAQEQCYIWVVLLSLWLFDSRGVLFSLFFFSFLGEFFIKRALLLATCLRLAFIFAALLQRKRLERTKVDQEQSIHHMKPKPPLTAGAEKEKTMKIRSTIRPVQTRTRYRRNTTYSGTKSLYDLAQIDQCMPSLTSPRTATSDDKFTRHRRTQWLRSAAAFASVVKYTPVPAQLVRADGHTDFHCRNLAACAPDRTSAGLMSNEQATHTSCSPLKSRLHLAAGFVCSRRVWYAARHCGTSSVYAAATTRERGLNTESNSSLTGTLASSSGGRSDRQTAFSSVSRSAADTGGACLTYWYGDCGTLRTFCTGCFGGPCFNSLRASADFTSSVPWRASTSLSRPCADAHTSTAPRPFCACIFPPASSAFTTSSSSGCTPRDSRTSASATCSPAASSCTNATGDASTVRARPGRAAASTATARGSTT
eukprot:Rhum_TRINITY_DN15001_c1_g1::Rhum_TRINITY_DN15001_c1_g1_i1::g.133211::m.133211